MKCCPYFVADALLLAVSVALFPLSFIYSGPLNYALPFVFLAFVAFRLATELKAAEDFDGAVKGIRGLRSWQSEFFSFGTLKLDYRGQKIRYSSEIRDRFDSVVPVIYTLSIANNGRKPFEIRGAGDGTFNVSGDRRFFESAKRVILAFDKKYEIRSIRSSDGLLRTDVVLCFAAGAPPSKPAKLGEMAGFLGDYLEFGLALKRKL